MKFIHIADIHFDKPFNSLIKEEMAEKRRLEIRENFKKVIDYVRINNIDFLFIAGDLYENEYIRKSTIDYINKCFEMIPNTKIFITPGNHDPFIVNSYYNRYDWNKNVYIFKDFEKIECNNINIFGYGFKDFYSSTININEELDTSKINILIMHADLNGATKEFGEYNPILESDLLNKNFDYVALGHIHKNNFHENKKIVYPGSLIAGGFDELGKHGMIEGTINEEDKSIKLNFIEIDNKEYTEYEIDISKLKSIEEIIEEINNLEIDENKYYKIILLGNKSIEVDVSSIIKYINNNNIIKIKDTSKYNYNIEEISKEQTLRGLFVKELLSQINEENKNEIMQSIYIGLDAM